MIIKPKRRGGFADFSDYLNGEGINHDENEECNFIASGNSLSVDNVNSWGIYANQRAALKRNGQHPLTKPIEHISIRSRKGDILKPEMITSKVPELLKALGYENCPWVLVQHIKDGEPHYHLGVCRVDDQLKTPNPDSLTVCKTLADKFAKFFGWPPAYAQKNGKQYAKRAAKLAGLWEDAETMKPSARLKHFMNNGFTPARGNRGQLVFVDRQGKPHSPQRIPAAKEKGLKQKDMPPYFGLGKDQMKALPNCKTITRAVISKGNKSNFKHITKEISNVTTQASRTARYNRYHGQSSIGRDFALPHLSARNGVRLQEANQSLPVSTHGTRFFTDARVQPVRSAGGLGIDPLASGRANAAADSIIAKYAAAIEDASKDPSLTPDQRAATVIALQQRQQSEAAAARQKILDEERQSAKIRRRNYRSLQQAPPKPF